MAGETKYAVWGYWAKNGNDTHHNRKLIDTAESLEEARQVKDGAEEIGWPTVCIFEGERIVEPAVWAGRQHPLQGVVLGLK